MGILEGPMNVNPVGDECQHEFHRCCMRWYQSGNIGRWSWRAICKCCDDANKRDVRGYEDVATQTEDQEEKRPEKKSRLRKNSA